MRRPFSATLLANALVLTMALVPLASASGQAQLSVSRGLAAPVNDLGDVADLGYHVAAGLNFGGTRLPIGARIEGSLSGFGLKDFNEDVRILNATRTRW